MPVHPDPRVVPRPDRQQRRAGFRRLDLAVGTDPAGTGSDRSGPLAGRLAQASPGLESLDGSSPLIRHPLNINVLIYALTRTT